jgi:serine/threonine-protein phosphatase PP1 catalytic subunit
MASPNPASTIPDDGWVDQMIDILLSARNKKPGTPVDLVAADATLLCTQAREVFMNQPMLLELGAPIKICGDVHGQYTDLLRLFEYGGFPPEVRFLYVRRWNDEYSDSCFRLLEQGLSVRFRLLLCLLLIISPCCLYI